MLHSLAQELNELLKGTSVEDLFSDMGKRMYFPKGIIAQGGEAKKSAYTANGTIGMTVADGKPVILKSVHKYAPELTSGEIVAYAPTAGFPKLRELWKAKQIEKNPSLKEKQTSLPIMVPGLTAGLSYIMDLFVDEEKPMLAPTPSWDNYPLIAQARRGAEYHEFMMFNSGKFNIEGMALAVKEEAKKYGSVRIILNFPQNPSGYSPTTSEVKQICEILKQTAQTGTKILVISDDAYYGLSYEDNIEKESLFAHIADLHENILAIKADGPTKEDFAWGLRCGFLTFACKGFSQTQYDALDKKLMGVIRSSVSCGTTISQSIMIKALEDSHTDEEKLFLREMLKKRYKAVRQFVDTHKSSKLLPLPFNSGYFMSFHTEVDAEVLRQKLLSECGIGTISIDSSTLRVAFSSIEEEKIEQVYTAIYETAEKI